MGPWLFWMTPNSATLNVIALKTLTWPVHLQLGHRWSKYIIKALSRAFKYLTQRNYSYPHTEGKGKTCAETQLCFICQANSFLSRKVAHPTKRRVLPSFTRSGNFIFSTEPYRALCSISRKQSNCMELGDWVQLVAQSNSILVLDLTWRASMEATNRYVQYMRRRRRKSEARGQDKVFPRLSCVLWLPLVNKVHI